MVVAIFSVEEESKPDGSTGSGSGELMSSLMKHVLKTH